MTFPHRERCQALSVKDLAAPPAHSLQPDPADRRLTCPVLSVSSQLFLSYTIPRTYECCMRQLSHGRVRSNDALKSSKRAYAIVRYALSNLGSSFSPSPHRSCNPKFSEASTLWFARASSCSCLTEASRPLSPNNRYVSALSPSHDPADPTS